MRVLFIVAILSTGVHARETTVELIRRLVDERHEQEQAEARAAESLFEASRAQFRSQRWHAALRTLAHLARGHASWASVAHVARAEIQEKLGNPQHAIAEYRAALRAFSVDTHVGMMDAGNTDSLAHRGLARLLEAEGDWLGAYRAWRAWRPHSWCGNELEAQANERRVGMARALFRLGRRM